MTSINELVCHLERWSFDNLSDGGRLIHGFCDKGSSMDPVWKLQDALSPSLPWWGKEGGTKAGAEAIIAGARAAVDEHRGMTHLYFLPFPGVRVREGEE